MSAKARTLTETQAAQQIGVSASTLSKLRRAGKVPSWRQVGRRVLYTSDDVDRFIAAKQRGQVLDCEFDSKSLLLAQINERRLTGGRFG